MKLLLISLVAALLVGCTDTWKSVSSPDVQGSNALASVTAFVATNGWNMHTNEGCIFWEDLQTKHLITGLPWAAWKGKEFEALTRGGILYVLLDSGWHHDYSGVAYNPNTNRFPDCIRGFKPVGAHWYVWAQPEFQSVSVKGRYE